MRYVLDTHAFLWFLTKDARLGSKAALIMTKIDWNEAKAFIPSIVLAEAIFILEKKKITGTTFSEIMTKIRRSSNYIIINLDWQILDQIAKHTDIPEIHDRIIVETAKLFDDQIISKDQTIRDLIPDTIW